MMVEPTPRDAAWLTVIDALRYVRNTDARTVADTSEVSLDTARRVLQVAEDDDLFDRDGDRDHIYRVAIGTLSDVDDPSYRRAVQTLVQEAKTNREGEGE